MDPVAPATSTTSTGPSTPSIPMGPTIPATSTTTMGPVTPTIPVGTAPRSWPDQPSKVGPVPVPKTAAAPKPPEPDHFKKLVLQFIAKAPDSGFSERAGRMLGELTAAEAIAFPDPTLPTISSVSIAPTKAVPGQASVITVVGTNFDPATAQLLVTNPSGVLKVVPNGSIAKATPTSLSGSATLTAPGTHKVAVENVSSGKISKVFDVPVDVAGVAKVQRVEGVATAGLHPVAPKIDGVVLVPAKRVTGGSQSITISGSGFDPDEAEVVVTWPDKSEHMIGTSALLSKSSTSLTAPIAFGDSGTYHVTVQNGSLGDESNSVAVSVD